MTFKEFLAISRARRNNVNSIETEIINMMLREGFTKEQVYTMRMKKLFPLWLDTVSNEFTNIFSKMAKRLEQNPNLSLRVEPFIKEILNDVNKRANEL
jgi:hypothetical protein